MLFRWLWVQWACSLPMEWRDALVPGWKRLKEFVKLWLYSMPEDRREIAMRFLEGGGDSVTPVAKWLQRLGSLTLAFAIIEGDKELDPKGYPSQLVQDLFRQQRITSRPTTVKNKKGVDVAASEDVTEMIEGPVQWRTVGSTTAAQLSAFRLLPEGVRE